MPLDAKARWERVRAGRVRILWLVLGALLLVSALPIGLYHRQVLQLSQDKLVDTERVQQNDLTRSLAQEIQLFESNLTQQLLSERQILTLTGLIDNVEDPAAEPKVTRLLEYFVQSNRNTFIYLTAVGKSGKGTSASQGNFRAEHDPFVARALQRAFVTCVQSQQLQVVKFRSDPLALAPDNRPAFVVSASARRQRQFHGHACRGRFTRSHPSPIAGVQRPGAQCFSGGPQRPAGGALGHKKFCSRRGRQQQLPGRPGKGAAAGAAQHGNGPLFRKRQETF